MFATQNVAILVGLVGLGIILATVVCAIRAGSAPFGLSASKDGVKVETNFIGASMLVGLLIFLGSGYFFIKDYEKQLGDLNQKFEGLRQAFNELVERSKGIDMKASLQFPASEASAIDQIKEASILIKRDGEVLDFTYPAKRGLRPNEKVVIIPGLHPNDDLLITITTGEKIYQSKEIIIPITTIEMVPEKK